MKFSDDETLPLALMGGVVQSQMLHVPPQVVMNLTSYRHACRFAWKLARKRLNITKRTLAQLAGLYPSHVTEYFSVNASNRELPAKKIADVERVLQNTVISQYLAQQSRLTVLEELQAARAKVAA